MQMESLQLEFMLSCPFFSTKKLYFFIVELFKDFILYLFLQKKDIREKNAEIAVRVSSFQFLKTASQLFSFYDFSRRLQGQNHNYRVPSFGNTRPLFREENGTYQTTTSAFQYRSLNARADGIRYP